MSVHLEVLVEEPSAQAALEELLPKLLPADASVAIHAHQGRPALLRKLPARLAAYAKMVWPDLRIVVLVDRDQEDCRQLKERLEAMAIEAGLTTKSKAGGGVFQVVNRIAVEELEAWFFGDFEGFRMAYPRVRAGVARQTRYRDPDAIRGGTAEALGRILYRAGCLGSPELPKISVAAAIGPHLDPARNNSRSFQCFCEGVRALMP